MLKRNYGKDLSDCESLVLKSTYDLMKQYDGEAVRSTEIIEHLAKKYDRNYARTTVATFITRMERKGFVQTYRNGRYSYVIPLMSEKDFVSTYIRDLCDWWFNGNAATLMKTLLNKDTPKSESDQIRKMLERM